MIIKNIRIQNFLAVKKLEYSFEDGLHLFIGNNGAGKTTILQALQVGLYNKTDRPQPWARISGPGGFIIEVDFIDIHGNEITTVNDRAKNKFEVYENSILLTHQISKGIPMVAEKLNLSYSEFTMLSYLTPATVSNILTGTDSSLISKFFSLHVLTDYDKSLREERKLLNRDKKAIEASLLDVHSQPKVHDLDKLKNTLSSLKSTRDTLLNSKDIQQEIATLESALIEHDADMYMACQKEQEIKTTLDGISSTGSECPTCGTKLDSNTTAKVATLEKLRGQLKEVQGNIKSSTDSYNTASVKLSTIKEPYEAKLNELASKIQQIEAEVLASSIIEERDTVDVDKLTSKLANIERKVNSLQVAIEAIKSGDVHKTYLQTFTSVLNNNLGKLKEILAIEMRVIAKIDSSGLSFSILEDGVYKSSAVLSAGEKVIVGLMVLTAMFDTLGDTLDIKVSTILLDEAISAVSTQNMEIVESLLKNLSSDKCVIVTQHHDELPSELFDTIKTIQKVDGLTEII